MTAIRVNSIDLAPDEWLFHVDAWVIEDGNYPNIEVGDRVASALAFEATDIVDASRSQPLVRRSGADYVIVAPMRRIHRRLWVLETGPMAYAERLNWEAEVGLVRMTARLFLDPFPFRETLGRLPGVPKMTHRWQVTGVWRHVAPRDAASIGHDLGIEPIERTDAVNDDGGTASYLLRGLILA